MSLAAPSESRVMPTVLVPPAGTVKLDGLTVIRRPASVVVLAVNVCAWSVTFFRVRFTMIAPGNGLTSMLGRFRSTRCSGSSAESA